jgi:hypothetical protein
MMTRVEAARRPRHMSEWSDGPAEHKSAEFGQGGQLLISALRGIAFGHGCSALTRRAFAIAFPGDANEVFATFRAFL